MSLLTWNVQGMNPSALILGPTHGFAPPFKNFVPDWICLQEAGDSGWGGNVGALIPCAWNPAPSFGGYKEITNAIIGTTQYNGYVVPWQANANGNQRCSMVILWKATLGAHAVMPINGWHDGNPAHRPVFWVTPAAGKRVGCIHAPSGGGPGNMAYIVAAVAAIAIAAPAAGWILAGDFNCTPGNLVGLPMGTGSLHTNDTTQKSGGNIDYLLHNNAAPFVNSASAQAYVQSDHLQVRFI